MGFTLWESLANDARFRCTAGNVYKYVAWAGLVDGQLAKLLNSQGHIVEHDTITEEQKLELSKIIFDAPDRLSESLRSALVRDLELQNYINVREIQPAAPCTSRTKANATSKIQRPTGEIPVTCPGRQRSLSVTSNLAGPFPRDFKAYPETSGTRKRPEPLLSLGFPAFLMRPWTLYWWRWREPLRHIR